MSTTIDPASNPKVERHIRQFLKALNSNGGPTMETMTPGDARQILIDAQASGSLDLPPCDIEQRQITQDSLDVRITIVLR
jgi:acetyl esterase